MSQTKAQAKKEDTPPADDKPADEKPAGIPLGKLIADEFRALHHSDAQGLRPDAKQRLDRLEKLLNDALGSVIGE